MIRLNNVSKQYGTKLALDELSLTIDSSGVYGLLGVNGAGKTTTIRCICGLTKLSHGSVSSQISAKEIGYMPEELALYKDMSVQGNLLYFCQILGLKPQKHIAKIMPLLIQFGLDRELHTNLAKLSKGNIRKVQFLCTILHNPKLLILDEPFSGLDPISTDIMIQAIANLKSQGGAILLSTHRIEQAETICDHIFMLHQGKLMIDAPTHAALNTTDSLVMFELITLGAVADLPASYLQKQFGEIHTYWIPSAEIKHPEIMAALENRRVISIKRSTKSLNEVFIDTVTQAKNR